jgi:hypothetical protein
MDDIPDPLRRGRIPGQNPNTPERMPGHTGAPQRRSDAQFAGWLLVAIVAGVVGMYLLGLVGH